MLNYSTRRDSIRRKGVDSVEYRLQELRKKLGLSMEEFGKRLGVTRSSISKLEAGKVKFTDQ